MEQLHNILRVFDKCFNHDSHLVKIFVYLPEKVMQNF